MTSPQVHGCWIGLKDILGDGNYQWLAPRSPNYRGFRDWRRFEPDNHTVTEGYSTLGELCIHVVPWQDDPLIVEQGIFDDSSCTVEKPFICQVFGRTTRYTLTVSASSYFDGGVIAGGILNLNGQSTIKLIGFRDSVSAQITSSSSATSSLGSVLLEDGSVLTIHGKVYINGDTWIGEINGDRTAFQKLNILHSNLTGNQLNLFFFDLLRIRDHSLYSYYDETRMLEYISALPTTIQPRVFLPTSSALITDSGSRLNANANANSTLFRKYGFDVYLNAAVEVQGNISVGNDVNFHLHQVLL